MSSRGGSLRAQSHPLPTVSISRLTALNQHVWPGDFNGDGITDLASTSPIMSGVRDGFVQVSLGNGTGAFSAPIRSNSYGDVLAVGDFNKDGQLDVLSTNTAHDFVVIAGNGDGTLGAAHRVAQIDPTNALAADIDGDGNLDVLALSDGGSSRVYPGNGDFTFDTPVTLTTGPLPSGAIADLNGDSRKDIVVANHDGNSISIFLNRGSLTFTAVNMPLDRQANHIAAADLNGDGRTDLVVAVSELAAVNPDWYSDGFAYVLFGNGDGTFAQPVTYPTAPGAWQVIVGDFNRDGQVDVATANRSSTVRDDCGGFTFKTWDTLSILPGNGDGTFGAPHNFSLANQSNLGDRRYKNTVVSLNTADLNGDHQTDLIASWGAIVINRPADPNWPPTVDAGPDVTFRSSATNIIVSAVANDSDQDMLAYSWTASDGQLVEPIPQPCVTLEGAGPHTFTVTVDDGHGHTATDSVTYTVQGGATPPSVTLIAPNAGELITAGTLYTIKWSVTSGSAAISSLAVTYNESGGGAHVVCAGTPSTATQCTWDTSSVNPTTRAHITVTASDANGNSGVDDSGEFIVQAASGPPGWSQADVGAVGAAGSVTYASGVFTVKGSGADIWGTADEFHYVWTQFRGDFSITTRVDSVQNVNAWTKAGLMIRLGLAPNVEHTSIFATPGKGIAFQWRPDTSSPSSNVSGPLITAPVWLRLVRTGQQITALYRKNATDTWTRLGSRLSPAMGTTVNVGLAVTSHTHGALATAALSNVTIAPPPAPFVPAIIGGGGGGWTPDDSTQTYTVQSKGIDIWGAADQFTYAYRPWSGDGQIVVDVNALTNTNPWAKAGVMFRSSTAANSAHVSLFVTPGKGVVLQYRASTGDTSFMAAQAGGAVPLFLRLSRRGNTFTAERSQDLTQWQMFSVITIPMPADLLAGLALTSHNTSAVATAKFVDPVISR